MKKGPGAMLQQRTVLLCAGAMVTLAFSSPGMAGVPDYDFDWAIIGDPGNPAYEGGTIGYWAGRGSINYTYRASRLEVTSAQWLEFINIFAPQSDNPSLFLRPAHSGLSSTAIPGHYVLRQDVENAGMLPVWGISWRAAAMYVNWLHNDKSTDWSAIMSGAYDAATFANIGGGIFTDQLAHSPDARFWIPTMDEWLKAAHYDPNRDGPGLGGWWDYPNTSNEPLIPGPPGIGQTSAGKLGFDAVTIPLGSYPDQQSPWGLLDLSGGVSEWTEEVNLTSEGLPIARFIDGAPANFGNDQLWQDAVYISNLAHPATFGIGSGLRVVSVIPAPGNIVLMLLYLATDLRGRKRRKRGRCTRDVYT